MLPLELSFPAPPVPPAVSASETFSQAETGAHVRVHPLRVDELVLANRGLAASCVYNFVRRNRVPPSLGLELDDLMGEARLALCRAAGKWDPARGRFSTYACTAIFNALISLCAPGRRAAFDRLPVMSLHTPIGKGDDDTLVDVLPDPGESVMTRVMDRAMVDTVWHAMWQLPERERSALLSMLDGRNSREIAHQWGCSRQRVDQIHGRAVKRLRQILGEWIEPNAEHR